MLVQPGGTRPVREERNCERQEFRGKDSVNRCYAASGSWTSLSEFKTIGSVGLDSYAARKFGAGPTKRGG